MLDHNNDERAHNFNKCEQLGSFAQLSKPKPQLSITSTTYASIIKNDASKGARKQENTTGCNKLCNYYNLSEAELHSRYLNVYE